MLDALSIAVRSPLPLGRAHMLASWVIREIRQAGLPAQSVALAGDLRRYAPEVGDVVLLAKVDRADAQPFLSGLGSLPSASSVDQQTTSSATIGTPRGAVTVHVAPPDQYGTALLLRTGSRLHTDHLIQRAVQLGFRIVDGQMTRDGRIIDAPSEDTIYRLLNLPYIAPELREGRDEIDAAERGALPALIADSHIRGDLHMHSTWSDGRDSIEAMVRASQRLGYEYVAITDHSHRAFSSRKLSTADIAPQREEILALREQVRDVTILHGVEVDIMQDGSLDFDDAVLEGFDIVLASLHDHGGQSVEALTSRYLTAMAHPLVNVITHPANRTPAVSPGYDLDFDALFAAAVETGTAMEVDGAPGHLDLDGNLARRAAAAGVTIVIDSDCHRTDALGRQMRFGVGTARRGWLEPRHVLNTRGIDAVRAFIAAKRASV
jgi:DNA polymerase (family X)